MRIRKKERERDGLAIWQKGKEKDWFYLDSTRRGRKEEAPWFTGEEDEDKDQKQHKEEETDNAL